MLPGDNRQTTKGGDGGTVGQGATDIERAAKSDVQSSLSNFIFAKVLGKGSFGKV